MSNDISPADMDIAWLYREMPELAGYNDDYREILEEDFCERVALVWENGVPDGLARKYALQSIQRLIAQRTSQSRNTAPAESKGQESLRIG